MNLCLCAQSFVRQRRVSAAAWAIQFDAKPRRPPFCMTLVQQWWWGSPGMAPLCCFRSTSIMLHNMQSLRTMSFSVLWHGCHSVCVCVYTVFVAHTQVSHQTDTKICSEQVAHNWKVRLEEKENIKGFCPSLLPPPGRLRFHPFLLFDLFVYRIMQKLINWFNQNLLEGWGRGLGRTRSMLVWNGCGLKELSPNFFKLHFMKNNSGYQNTSPFLLERDYGGRDCWTLAVSLWGHTLSGKRWVKNQTSSWVII